LEDHLFPHTEFTDWFRDVHCAVRSGFLNIIQVDFSLKSETLAIKLCESDFGGLEVAYWPLVPEFAGSNLAETVGFFRRKKSSARLPSEGK
jgi:hypothetical protein